MSKSETSDVRKHLFNAFLDRLKEQTSLIALYGDNFTEACLSLNYATAVRYEMLNAESNPRFSELAPSAHTLLRWLQRGDFSAQVQSKSLLAVSRYLGYEHFDDFRKSIQAQQESVLTAPVSKPKDVAPLLEDAKPMRSKSRGIGWGILGALLITIVTYGFVVLVFQTKAATTPPSELELKSLIERANAFEYALYAQVGRQPLDTSGHHLFFTKDAPAWMAIDKVLKGSLDPLYVLNLDRSSRALVSVELEKATDSTVIVRSLEAWTILWESEVAMNTRYDEVNEQYYTLKKENDRWKIDMNAYAGTWKPAVDEEQK